ncbi:MarR family transcriptional regulator [Microbacterium resistens]|uniref:MarR family winged helix-turn-helix transcriptional regulator n=1 Tax=Microbacterium TaxID=33882 RepID=UPI001C55B7E1|nr:MarR family transcriptional regulator [Microbacterium resistens]MBW1637526.1 MarR family transcriptional regulator [Microbacterium resistens]
MKTDCYCTSLRVAARRASAIYDRALEPVGINVAQWGLLRRLPFPGSEPITIQDLAERAELERSTVARNLRVLVKLGLVEMTASPADRRATALVLTEKAVAVTAEALPLWESAQAEIEQMLTADSAAQLRQLALSI